MPTLIWADLMSAVFRHRGVPSLDWFTATIVGSFRRAFDFHPMVSGYERKFMTLCKWECEDDVVAPLWTIEPVVSSVVIKGNRIDVRSANEK